MEIRIDLSNTFRYVIESKAYKVYIFQGKSDIPGIDWLESEVVISDVVSKSTATIDDLGYANCKQYFTFKIRQKTNKYHVYIFLREMLEKDQSIVETLRFLLPKEEMSGNNIAPMLIYQRFLTDL